MFNNGVGGGGGWLKLCRGTAENPKLCFWGGLSFLQSNFAQITSTEYSEMPTSGDLNSGDSLFFNIPSEFQQTD